MALFRPLSSLGVATMTCTFRCFDPSHRKLSALAPASLVVGIPNLIDGGPGASEVNEITFTLPNQKTALQGTRPLEHWYHPHQFKLLKRMPPYPEML